MSKFIIFSGFWLISFALNAKIRIVELTCDYRTNPIGIGHLQPVLNWKISSSQYNIIQTAYQILVADNLRDLKQDKGNIWDSKKVSSSASIQHAYAGPQLISGKIYYWKVKVWDNQHTTAWSAIADWRMGLLHTSDWKGAKWIAYEKLADSNINVLPTDGKKDKFNANNILPIFRKSFKVDKQVKNAVAYISGLGQFEMHINGQKTGDHFLSPGWTKYDKEALYVAFDVTSQLKKGENAIGVLLGNGFYYVPPVKGRYRKLKSAFGYPKMICRIHITYADGSSTDVVSNPSWKTAPSAITFSSIYGGEDYNANLEQQGWDEPGFKDDKWKLALSVDGPALKAQREEPVKVFEHFSPKQVNAVADGQWVYDLGQNASGIIELKVSGKKGDTVRIIPAELLKSDGSVTQKNIGGPSYFTYILKGGGTETWSPRFTYTGFRYLQVKGAVPSGKAHTSGQPLITSLKGLHIRNAAAKVGSFSSSNTLFNKTYDLIDWAIKSNMVSVFTDCPHREKLGWLEELHLMGSSVRYNYNAAPLFKKALQDMKNSQLENGLIPEIAPEYVKFEWGGDMFRDSPEWGSSGILMPWYLYQWYGDQQAITDNYAMMQRYIDYLGTKAQHHILSQGLGDWYDLGPHPPGVSQLTPMGVTGTAIYYYDLIILNKMATLTGKKADALKYAQLAKAVREAFNKQFFNTQTKQYATGSQAANAMAVYMGLVEEKDKAAVIDNLVKDIRAHQNSLTAGDIGYRYVLRVLEDAGRSDVIFDMNSRSDVPGYGMQIEKGATALTESWAALPTVSNNHFMLGHLMEWFYSGVGGIGQQDDGIAFSKIRIYPQVTGDLSFAKTSYNSPYGLIATDWKKTGQSFEMEIDIPANTTAILYLPAGVSHKIEEESGAEFQKIGYASGRAKIGIGSGHYKFKVN
ncbi:family 78 glycoside hydrolase catalytic domain [Pedobacter sp. MR2016-24]|uniref:family 78 glycoside hydrolase catalytic domain n=1 Tax=Pedobacter sp. MR2016-24 TaxID=2994466 RepID=UPI0022466FE0|nr:family 78 glycoside hydrolase catalytic domain [Pedobacter sp. MR2016-24]MCX2484401.1 family 78 glycoside hydrolase catalytic domain [Pedobacter sp. MR2016-24]